MAKTYSEKLKDPRWQKMRLQVMERDDFTCRDCKSKTETLNVHHSHYRKGAEPWDYEDRFLITLCEECHKEAEAHRELLLKATADPERQRRILTFAILSAGGSTPYSGAFSPMLDDIWSAMISEKGVRDAMLKDDQSEALNCVEELKATFLEVQRWFWMVIQEAEKGAAAEVEPFPDPKL